MDLNGVPASGNRWLFTEVLREQWGFDGFVVSDANAVRNLVTHGFAADLADAARPRRQRRRRPGDGHDRPGVRATCPEAVQRGDVSVDAVDACVRRVLEAKLRLGLFDDPYVDEDRARRFWPTRRTARSPGWPPSVRRCCCATRATCCRSTPASLSSIAVVGAARRLPARHPGPVGLRLRPGRDGHGAGRAAGTGSATATEVRLRARDPAGPARRSRRCSTCSPATRRPTRRTSTTRRSCSGRSSWPRLPTWPSWWSASGSR